MSDAPQANAAPGEMSVRVSAVTVSYPNGNVALRDASFALAGGSICALVGVNGSGKSTLFKAIMGLLKPVAGTVTIAGRPVKAVLMGRYGYMNFMRTPRAEDRRIAEESLRRVGMLEFRERQIGELSGGQRKRVFLARALAQRGRVILLDEPFTGVDVNTETAIIALLRELRNDGHIILVSTHNLGSVPEFCDHVVLVNRTVLAAGPIGEVFTEANLLRTFGGVLRHFRFDESTVQSHDGRAVTLLTDDERPLVFGKGGHVEYSKRAEHAEILKKRAEGEEDV
jgi:manganese/iron transport system ATP-binding protein